MVAQEAMEPAARKALREARMAIQLTPEQEVEAMARFAGKLAVRAARNPVVQLVSAAGADIAVNIANRCPVSPQGVATRLALGLVVIGISSFRKR